MAGSGKASPIPADLLARYDRLIATQAGVARKGATMPYTSVSGNMFSYLQDGHLVLRLPAGEREAFLERHGTRLHETHGIVQKEYVDVPDDLFAHADRLADAFGTSYAYSAALKPKRTTRRAPRTSWGSSGRGGAAALTVALASVSLIRPTCSTLSRLPESTEVAPSQA
jgi:hypothetical protein